MLASAVAILVTGGEIAEEDKSVLLVLLLRNKAHTLPHFLAMLDALEYPKKRISLFIRSDHNEDDTVELLRKWLADVESDYANVDVEVDERNEFYASDRGPVAWTDERFDRIIALKEEALKKSADFDYVWFLDADAFISNQETLRYLIAKGHAVSAPLLTTVGPYSNFWAGMSQSFYYERTPDYLPILERKKNKRGCFEVPMIHSSVLVRRDAISKLTFDNEKVEGFQPPKDDIIAFALSAKAAGIPLHVCNEQQFGHIMNPLEDDSQLEDDYEKLRELRLYMIADGGPVPRRTDMPLVPALPEEKHLLGTDKVYLINLRRRPDRKAKMDACFDELGIDYDLVEAVDGKQIDENYLDREGIGLLKDYEEPHSGRNTLTYGEIGCFLSHHIIWKEMVAKGYDKVVVFEDDARFEPEFLEKMDELHEELDRLKLEWDLVYLGRKIMERADESFVDGSRLLLRPDYTYWTLSYMLSASGARKLLDADPLSRMVPVDEYIPILYDRHPNATWKAAFEKRDLQVFAVQPVYVHPTHYTGEDGYFTDTEWAEAAPPETLLKDEL